MSNIESGQSTSTPNLSDPRNVPADFKDQGSDWVATFNPQGEQDGNLRKAMDVNYSTVWITIGMHLEQLKAAAADTAAISVVCSIRFSADGKYLATGSNHSANIYDVETGKKLWLVVSASSPTLLLTVYLGQCADGLRSE